MANHQEDAKVNYGINLRYCCDYYKSISEVCRKLSLNRQQFNKYLSGVSSPSNHNHRSINDFFGLDYHELYLPHQEFELIFQAKQQIKPVDEAGIIISKQILELLATDSHETRVYSGYYFKYFYSMTDPRKIRRDLCHFFIRNGVLCSATKEAVSISGRQVGSSLSNLSYRGVVALLGGRIFWIECDRQLQSEVSLSILFPSPTRIITQLEGIVLGTGVNRARRILASQVVLDYLGDSVNLRKCLSNVGVFCVNSDHIPENIRSLLGRDSENEKVVLSMDS